MTSDWNFFLVTSLPVTWRTSCLRPVRQGKVDIGLLISAVPSVLSWAPLLHGFNLKRSPSHFKSFSTAGSPISPFQQVPLEGKPLFQLFLEIFHPERWFILFLLVIISERGGLFTRFFWKNFLKFPNVVIIFSPWGRLYLHWILHTNDRSVGHRYRWVMSWW